jgi:DNA modification methylase
MSYENFLKNKIKTFNSCGFDADDMLIPEKLFPFQKAIVKWALKKGRAAIFADTGLGKSFMQVAWANAVHQYSGNRVLIVAPLCVAPQTVQEADKLGVNVKYVREMVNDTGIFITNYEMIENFREAIDKGYFDGIVLDESSILKHQDSKTRAKIIDIARDIPYRLSCTATPSPNDFMELGSQAEFLGIMPQIEMLSMFFVHDSGETSKWRLKGHGKAKFWEWLSSWCVYIKRPSDIGFSDEGYVLPPLNYNEIKIGDDGGLSHRDLGLAGRQKAKKDSIDERVKACADIVNERGGTWVVWCHRNDESKMLTEAINGAVEIKGSDTLEKKEKILSQFANGEIKILISKPKLSGFGLNWQHCSQMAFVGLNDSFEQIYQATRRCWRFGQTKPVDVFFVCHALEGPVLENVKTKEEKAKEMAESLVGFMKDFQTKAVQSLKREIAAYNPDMAKGKSWTLYNADCVEVARNLQDESIDYSVFSPPFSSLYTYSNSERDMGNCTTDDEFWGHFKFLIDEFYRILRTGRNISVHCMNLPASKVRDGYIGIKDFRGDIIRAFEDAGFVYHSEVVIWKNPVVAMQRTKALGLLWKQIKKDSSRCRQGIPDYVVTFRKDGDNTKPISHTPDEFPVSKWQHYASPCWFDIDQSNTLNKKMARDQEDERHIAPLQLDLIQRCLELWSAPDDLVFSPFTGIGSEGVVSLQLGRRFIGAELKKSYFDCAKRYLADAENGGELVIKDFDTEDASKKLKEWTQKKKQDVEPIDLKNQTSFFDGSYLHE